MLRGIQVHPVKMRPEVVVTVVLNLKPHAPLLRDKQDAGWRVKSDWARLSAPVIKYTYKYILVIYSNID